MTISARRHAVLHFLPACLRAVSYTHLFGIEEAARRATIIQYLLSDAGQIAVWPTIEKHLAPGKALYLSLIHIYPYL